MTDPRPIIIGEAPSKSGDRYYLCPLSGAVGERLCRWAGIEPDEQGSRYGRWYWPLRRHFELRNLLERYPGAQGRGAAFPMALARPAAEELLPELYGRRVVMLGARVPAAFGLSSDPFEWKGYVRVQDGPAPALVEHGSSRGFTWCVIPHPSGLNRAYNDPGTQRRASEALRYAIGRPAPEPEPSGVGDLL